MYIRNSTILLLLGVVLLLLGGLLMYRVLPGYMEHRPAFPDTPASSPSEPSLIPAPELQAADASGEAVSLMDLQGKPTVLHFWATWNEAAAEELDVFEEVYGLAGDSVNFVMLHCTEEARETRDMASAFILEHGYTFPVYYDIYRRTAESYGLRGIPATVFIDPDGYLAGAWEGQLTKNGLLEGIGMISQGDGLAIS